MHANAAASLPAKGDAAVPKPLPPHWNLAGSWAHVTGDKADTTEASRLAHACSNVQRGWGRLLSPPTLLVIQRERKKTRRGNYYFFLRAMPWLHPCPAASRSQGGPNEVKQRRWQSSPPPALISGLEQTGILPLLCSPLSSDVQVPPKSGSSPVLQKTSASPSK